MSWEPTQTGAEVICVGTELLLGDILNTNAQFLAQELANLGIPHYFQTVVGDNPQRLQQAIATACQRAQILIFTGGLGPTSDDLTTETIADFFQTPLRERPEIRADLEQKFAHRLHISANNWKQALLPDGADILANATGSAPGMVWSPRPGLTILTFPGVPRELEAMWSAVALPFLRGQGWGTTRLYSRVLRFWGVSESRLAEQVAPFLEQSQPTVAPYAQQGETRLRITARAASTVQAEAVIAPVEAQIRQICGADCYGADQDTLASVVGQLLRDRNQTVAIAESCTGGGLGQHLTTPPGSSAYFVGGITAYANAVKVNQLGVDAQVIEHSGAVSAPVVEQMATGIRRAFGADWGLSITGVAGPQGGTPTKPVGLVYFGLASPDDRVISWSRHIHPEPGREWVRQLSISHALDLLRRSILSIAAVSSYT